MTVQMTTATTTQQPSTPQKLLWQPECTIAGRLRVGESPRVDSLKATESGSKAMTQTPSLLLPVLTRSAMQVTTPQGPSQWVGDRHTFNMPNSFISNSWREQAPHFHWLQHSRLCINSLKPQKLKPEGDTWYWLPIYCVSQSTYGPLLKPFTLTLTGMVYQMMTSKKRT